MKQAMMDMFEEKILYCSELFPNILRRLFSKKWSLIKIYVSNKNPQLHIGSKRAWKFSVRSLEVLSAQPPFCVCL